MKRINPFGGKTHFQDTLPPELKQTLSSHGLLSDHHNSLLSQLQPPDYIQQRLSPLHGLCTYKLLDRLRYGNAETVEWDRTNVAATITDWFDCLREPMREENYQPPDAGKSFRESLTLSDMNSSQWTCMGEELLALDKATHVPRVTPETQRIFRAVKSIPEWVVQRLKDKHSDADIEVIPIGSFPCDTKVLDIDEFDFILLCNTHESLQSILHDSICLMYETLFPHHVIKKSYIGEMYRTNSLYSSYPHVTSVYGHGPASCVEISWLCHDNHVHKLGVDITLAYKDSKTNLKSICIPLKQHPTFNRIYDIIEDDDKCVRILEASIGAVTTASLDKSMYTVMREISPNIIAANRLLKVLLSHILPSTITREKNPASHKTTAILNSHKVKHVVFCHAAAHPDPQEWSVERLDIRLKEMIEIVHDSRTEELAMVISPEHVSSFEGALHDLTSEISKRRKIFKVQSFLEYKDNLAGLHQILDASYKMPNLTFEDEPPSKRRRTSLFTPLHHNFSEVGNDIPSNITFLICKDKSLFPCDSHPFRLFNIGTHTRNTMAYSLSETPMLYSTHPLMKWCRKFVMQKYLASPGPNISQIPLDDFGYTWMLHQAGILDNHALTDESIYTPSAAQFKAIKLFAEREDGIKQCQVLGEIIDMALSQINILADIASAFPEEYHEDLLHITICLSALDTKQKAFVYKWCHSAIEHKSSDMELVRALRKLHFHLFTTTNTSLWTLFQIMDYIWATLTLCQPLSRVNHRPSCILVYYVIKHVLTKDSGYFDRLSEEHLQWAEHAVTSIINCNANDYLSPDLCVTRRTCHLDWNVFRMTRDMHSLYRCLTYGTADTEQLQRTAKSSFGMNLDQRVEANEMITIRKLRVNFDHATRHTLVKNRHRCSLAETRQQ